MEEQNNGNREMDIGSRELREHDNRMLGANNESQKWNDGTPERPMITEQPEHWNTGTGESFVPIHIHDHRRKKKSGNDDDDDEKEKERKK